MSARSRLWRTRNAHYTALPVEMQLYLFSLFDLGVSKQQHFVIAVIFHRVLRSVGGRVSNLPLNDLLNWSTDVSISFGAWEEREWLTSLDLRN